ncbi:MAG: acyl-CoA reductase, partial [Solirubrobacterales bacterium]|nr:acyl-CoA reductase [Solirubrobacterales bacterium]
RELTRATTDTPIAYLDAALSGLALAFDGETVLAGVDRELAFGSAPGRDLIDGWRPVTGSSPQPGLTAQLSGALGGGGPLPRTGALEVRAFPTRQLHITAGNSPMIPVISAVRGLAVKGAVTLKMPSGALAAGAALAVALYLAGPEHPLTQHASIVYWQGGDPRIEDRVLAAEVFDRIVVWGAPHAVNSVRARAGLTKTLTFNPRYGASLIGAEALTPGSFDETIRRAVTDTLIWNQKACIASLVHYVEGDGDTAHRYADALTLELARWDARFPSPMNRDAAARLRQARRGGMRHGTWHVNGDARAPTSAAVVFGSTFDLSTHPASRIIAVRPVADLDDAIRTFHPGVSEVGVAPEARRTELRDLVCAHGVTGVPPLGEADAVDVVGIPQDGIRTLSELVSWATA